MSCTINLTFWHTCGHTTSDTEHETGEAAGMQLRCPTLSPRTASLLGSVLDTISPRACRYTNTIYTYAQNQCPDCPNQRITYTEAALTRRRLRYQQLQAEQQRVHTQGVSNPLDAATNVHDFHVGGVWLEELRTENLNNNVEMSQRESLGPAETRRLELLTAERREVIKVRALEEWLRQQEVTRLGEELNGVALRDQSLVYHPVPDQTDDKFLVKSRLKEDDICPICREHDEFREDGLDLPVDVRQLPCGHKLHLTCITQWFDTGSNGCPMCRARYRLVRVPNFDIAAVRLAVLA